MINSKPTKGQLALFAWTISNPPPGASFQEQMMLGNKLTHLLTDSERRQVSEFIRDKETMLKALKRRTSKPWR